MSSSGDASGYDEDLGAPEKEYFASERTFLYICVSFAVSYQALALFPLLVLKHGGVSFLVPYTVILLTVGVPMVALEILLGQFRGKGCLDVWTCVPVGKGVGMSMLLKTFVVGTYKTILDSYIIFYFLQAFQAELPWNQCFRWWGANILNCAVKNITVTRYCNAERHRLYEYNVGKNISLARNTTVIEVCGKKLKISTDAYDNGTSTTCMRREPGPELSYLLYGMLKISTGIDDFGGVCWQLMVCYLFSWFITFVCTSSGVPSVGRVAPCLATVPFVLLVLLATQMMFLPDGREALLQVLKPRWHHVQTIEAWSDAIYYILNGFNIGLGKMYCFASYNPFESTALYRAFVLLPLFMTLSNILSCMVVIGGSGTLAKYMGQCVGDFPSHPLIFPYLVFPQLVVHLPLPNLWTGIFFMTLYLMSIDEMMGNVGTVVTCAEDLFPSIRTNMNQIVFMICTSMCIAGIPLVTQAGPYVMELLDEHAVAALLSHFTSMVEVCLIAWLYGLRRLSYDIQFMMGYKPSVYFRFCWLVVCPGVLTVFYFHRVLTFEPMQFFRYVYPKEYEALAWIIGGVALLQVPIGATAAIMQNLEFPGRAFLPEAFWAPNAPDRVDAYYEELEDLGIEGESTVELPDILNEETGALELSVDPDAPLRFNPPL